MPPRKQLKLKHWRKLLFFHGMRVGLAASARVAPNLATRWAMRLFATPYGPRHIRLNHEEIPAFTERHIPLRSSRRQHKLRLYVWGDPVQQPTVLLIHGWSGWGLQLSQFVAPLLAAGFSVAAVDMPAHGHSSGHNAHFFSWLDALREASKQFPKLQTIIGHSLGGATLGYALAQGLVVPQAVLIGAPAELLAELNKFSAQLWLPKGFGDRMANTWNQQLGKVVQEVRAETGQISGAIRGLLVHDRNDNLVPMTDMYRYQRVWPGAKTLITEGLGHTRLLKDPKTIQQIVNWLTNNNHQI